MKTGKFEAVFIKILVIISIVSSPAAGQRWRSVDEKLLEILDIKEGMVVADVGAGNGRFSFRMADAVGQGGHVYANEIKVNLIDRINDRKEEEGIENLTTVLSEDEDPGLPVPVDLILLKFVYHHLSKQTEFMTKMREYLKPGGRLVIVAVDINQVSPSRANNPSRDACISDPDDTIEEVEKTGYVFDRKEFIEGGRDVNYVLFFARSD